MVTQLWSCTSEADFLRPAGEGGSVLLLLPDSMELPLFGRVVDSVSAAVSAHLNAESTQAHQTMLSCCPHPPGLTSGLTLGWQS